LAAGESTTCEPADEGADHADTGTKRQSYDLHLDLRNPDKSWFDGDNATSRRPGRLRAARWRRPGCCASTVMWSRRRPTSWAGEVHVLQPAEETGGGSQLLTNLYNGNVVWSYDALSNPSIGPVRFRPVGVQQPGWHVGVGYGFSVQQATLARLGEGLSVVNSNLMAFRGRRLARRSNYKLGTQDPAKPQEIRL